MQSDNIVTSGRTKMIVAGSVIKGFEDVETGLSHIATGQDLDKYCGLFRLIVPSVEWKSRFVDSKDQKATGEQANEDRRSILFDDLVARDGKTTSVMAEINISRSAAADEILFQLSLKNLGANDITEVVFPRFGGWTGQGGSGQDAILLGAKSKFDPHSLPRKSNATYGRWHQKVPENMIDYPVNLNVPWMDISGPRGGLSYINYMTSANNGYVAIENEAGYGSGFWLAFGWAHIVCIKPGASWVSPEIGVSVHAGDWHVTADRYRVWMKKNLPPIRKNKSLCKSIGFQNVFFRGFDGEPIRPYQEIPAVAASARRYGVNHISIWDYTSLGNYVMRPECELLDYNQNDRAVIKSGIKQAQAAGSDVSLLINFRHLNPSATWYKAHQAEIKRCYDGTPQTENWAASGHHGRLFVPYLGPDCNVYSPFSSLYRKRVLNLVKKCRQLGYASIFYDQPWELKPDYAFVDRGRLPEETQAATVELIGQVRNLLPENGILIGEECDVFAAQHIEMWMSWAWSAPAAAERVARLRYSLPDTMLAWNVDSEPERASLAFALGMCLCLCVHGNEGLLDDEPALAEHVARLARLRQLTAERTTMARFNDQRGLTVDGDGNFRAYSYDGDAGPAVIAAAIGKGAKGRVTVDCQSFGAPGKPGEGICFDLNGNQTMTKEEIYEFDLKDNEVAVWIL